MPTRRLTGVAAVAVIALAPGCGGGGTTSDTMPLATYPPAGEGSDGAALGGVLELRDGCVIVGGDDPIIPVFPNTVSWDVQAESVVYADGTRLAMGERIMLGGGFVEDGVPSFADVPSACPEGLAFFIVGLP